MIARARQRMPFTCAALLTFAVCVPTFRVALGEQTNWHGTRQVVFHDADTVRCDILQDWGAAQINVKVRATYDAMEVNRVRRGVEITDEELRLGKQARDALRDMIDKGGRLELGAIDGGTLDGFGRPVALFRMRINGRVLDLEKWAEENDYLREQ